MLEDFPEQRIFRPRFPVQDISPFKEFIGKVVTVRSWHNNTRLLKTHPRDKRVGFVLEFCCDVPESELERLSQQTKK